ncbi:hypothetical protein JX265_001679 [Neoarthrinium moseri]|uniref:Uncharacterized protein n=1 Tax=Neoarthrinium moseri TaxID=1658444 RepID=A0A9P9WVN7_9PEZI|nr:uncharacterized protein JN550_005252 [Neoarthrinium moseri]KAI1870324.1 hypothetical protein JN550_005252 [Neoarthrinium moseri]KAI1880058.1 hypothetical protein JX265_001679 [Neoarthrinium moseri]
MKIGVVLLTVAASSLATAAVVADRPPTNENLEHNVTSEVRDLVLEKRRSSCGEGMTRQGEWKSAVDCLLGKFDDKLYLDNKKWKYCMRGETVAFVCPYSGGYKSKDDIKATFKWVSDTCVYNPPFQVNGQYMDQMGYNQVSGGQGDWTAGIAEVKDHFCDKNYYGENGKLDN